MEAPLIGGGNELMLDGNAAAGLLQEVFQGDVTTGWTRCAYCGKVSMIGALLDFGGRMGTVLRCPVCECVIIRVVERPNDILLDMEGTRYVRMPREVQ